MSRATAVPGALAGLLLVAGLAGACAAPPAALVVRGGTLVDGTGAPARRADVLVRGARIAAIGDTGAFDGLPGTRTIDAAGLVVAPGFVDVHSHADLLLLAPPATQERLLEAKVRQGVTTLVVGNCGLGPAPSDAPAAAILEGVNAWMTPAGVRAGALDVRGYLERLERGGTVTNVATLVPHGPLRVSAMGLAPGAPSSEALDAMRAALDRALDAGAFGLSFGLIYPPGMYSDTDELVALAEVVARRDGVVTLHVRGSSETLLDATRELIEVAQRSGARLHHSHLEAVGEPFWRDAARVLALEDAARARGLPITHDVFPYTRAATMMAAVFPPWSLEGGLGALVDRLGDPAVRGRIRREIETRVPEWPPWREGGWPHNLVGAVGWDGIVVASVPEGSDDADLVGRSLAEIAAEAGTSPFDELAGLMARNGGRVGQQVLEISGDGDGRGALDAIVRHPAGLVVSDAEDYGRGAPHPAHAGAFARALSRARERGDPALEEAVRRMTGAPAALLGLPGRGRIAERAPADLVLFDPGTVADRASWEAPRRHALGVSWVLIGGRAVVEDGAWRGGLPGRVLRAGRRRPPR